MEKRVEVIRQGLFSLSVCAVNNATDEEILEECNAQVLCGTVKGWCIVIREHEKKDLLPV